jgi:hypothetical protein
MPATSNWDVTVGTGYRVILSWSNCSTPGNPVTYKLNVWDSYTNQMWTFATSTNEYILTAVEYSTQYKWSVEAIGGCGSSQYGPLWEFITEVEP